MSLNAFQRACGPVVRLALLVAAGVPVCAHAAPAIDTAPGLSWQGYTGLFNIPHARVTPFGAMTAGYSTQVELAGEYITGSNYLLSLGLLPNLEINGRIATNNNSRNYFQNPSSDPGIRDLSFNAKFRLPTPDAWPNLAVGLQDPAGETQDFKAEYAVATERWGPVDISLGFGRSDSAIGRLDGAFGGVSWAATDWMDVIAEHDAHAANAGVRLHHATRLGDVPMRVDLDLQVASSASEQDGSFAGISLTVPLGGATEPDHGVFEPAESREDAAPEPGTETGAETGTDAAAGEADAAGGSAVSLESGSEDAADATDSAADDSEESAPAAEPLMDTTGRPPLPALIGRLQAHGFENISVGQTDDALVMRAENTVYNRNELDGLGVMLAQAVPAATERFERIRVVLLNVGVPVIGVEVPTQAWRCYLGRCEGEAPGAAAVRAGMRVFEPGGSEAEVNWRYRDESSSALRPRLILSPDVVTGVATEVGVLDYSLGLRAELRVPLWTGAQAVVSAVEPLTESEDFEEGAIFGDQALESGIRDIVLQQALPVGPAMAQLSAGRFRDDYYGALGEGVWQSADGHHRLSGRAGVFEDRRSDVDEERELALGSYRYYSPRFDAALEVTTGRFWGQDEGTMVESHHQFGDTTISLFYRRTVGEFVGIRATLPLTPRRDMDPSLFQVRGDPRWRYSLNTRVGEDRNVVSFATGDTLRRGSSLEQQFFNGDRLNAAYIRRHVPRMRDAAMMYE
ncbi:YjbH domain-containing protein [Halofilum ochraceum]|uniref:YjbH domain-containing protein n=1 Tax=Halofilum ochraceum TaxID=1611323 RepID=UPI001586D88A|nr:YjbH domain-containing protein [Halofilum ochraceum]